MAHRAAPAVSVAANRFLTGLTNVLYGASLTDMETCYKVMRTEIAQALKLEANRFDIEPEITAKLLRAGHRIVERPVQFEPRSRAQGQEDRLARRRQGDCRPDQVQDSLMLARVVAIALAVAAAALRPRPWHLGGGRVGFVVLRADGRRLRARRAAARESACPGGALAGGVADICPRRASSRRRSVRARRRPSARRDFAALLAPLRAAGGPDAIFFLSPLAGGVVVWLTFVLGRRLAGAAAGVVAALIMAATPIFVFQLVQPMNDVVVTALWTGVVVLAARPSQSGRAHSIVLAIGALTGLAVLVRPNLAPVAAVVVGSGWCAAERGSRWRRFRGVRSPPSVPFVALAGALNQRLYGASARVWLWLDAAISLHWRTSDRTSAQYGRALLETQLAFPLLGVAAAAVAAATRSGQSSGSCWPITARWSRCICSIRRLRSGGICGSCCRRLPMMTVAVGRDGCRGGSPHVGRVHSVSAALVVLHDGIACDAAGVRPRRASRSAFGSPATSCGIAFRRTPCSSRCGRAAA